MLITNRWLATSLTLLWAWGGFFANVTSGGPAAPGRGVYQMRCQPCHSPDGLASPQMEKMLKVPIPQVTGEALKQKSDAEMLQIIADGKGKMPEYAKTLSPEGQQQVLTFMRTLGRPQ
jgi:mono/diheme cytochrome c family protein